MTPNWDRGNVGTADQDGMGKIVKRRFHSTVGALRGLYSELVSLADGRSLGKVLSKCRRDHPFSRLLQAEDNFTSQ